MLVENSRKLLRLEPGGTDHHYMSCPAIMYSEWTRELTRYIERLEGRSWQKVLCEQPTISEYSMYGNFVEEVLRPSDLIVRDRSFSHMLWDAASYNAFFADVNGAISRRPEKLCAVVQSAMNIPVKEYSGAVEGLLV